VKDLEFRVPGLGIRLRVYFRDESLCCRVQGAGCKVSGFRDERFGSMFNADLQLWKKTYYHTAEYDPFIYWKLASRH